MCNKSVTRVTCVEWDRSGVINYSKDRHPRTTFLSGYLNSVIGNKCDENRFFFLFFFLNFYLGTQYYIGDE